MGEPRSIWLIYTKSMDVDDKLKNQDLKRTSIFRL